MHSNGKSEYSSINISTRVLHSVFGAHFFSNWLNIIKKVNDKHADVKKYSFFMQNNITPYHVNTNTNTDYSDGVKKFMRIMIYHLLGDGNAANPVYPINDTDFFKRRYRSVTINTINTADPSNRVAANDIIRNNNNQFVNYIKSLKLNDSSSDDFVPTFFKDLGKGAVDKIFDNLTLVDDWIAWGPDGKGKILMSDNADTVSFDHPDAGAVRLEAIPNPSLGKLKGAEYYLKQLFIKMGT